MKSSPLMGSIVAMAFLIEKFGCAKLHKSLYKLSAKSTPY